MRVPQGDRPALPLMLLLQLQPPVPHAPYINSESYRRQPAQMEHRGLQLHTVFLHMQSLKTFRFLECARVQDSAAASGRCSNQGVAHHGIKGPVALEEVHGAAVGVQDLQQLPLQQR